MGQTYNELIRTVTEDYLGGVDVDSDPSPETIENELLQATNNAIQEYNLGPRDPNAPLSAQSRRTPTPTRNRLASASGSSRSFCPSRLRLPSRRSTMPSSSAGRQTRGTETTTWACTSRRGTPRASTTPEATTSRDLSAAMTQRSANATSMRSLRSCARCARWCPPAPTPTSSP